MGRLIDSEQTKLMLSELLEVAKKENFNAEDAIEHACVWVDNIPTAYDVEKVVEGLEDKKGTYFDGLKCEGTMMRMYLPFTISVE